MPSLWTTELLARLQPERIAGQDQKKKPIMTMQETVQKNMHKFQVGHQMFCPLCQTVLDVRQSVSVDILKGAELLSTRVLCAKCYDAKAATLAEGATNTGVTLEIYDGRKKRK